MGNCHVGLAVYCLATKAAPLRLRALRVQVPRGRMPELVLASYCCALLLRLSYVPLQSSSGLGSALYRHGAVLLTLGSTCTAASQAQQVCFRGRSCIVSLRFFTCRNNMEPDWEAT